MNRFSLIPLAVMALLCTSGSQTPARAEAESKPAAKKVLQGGVAQNELIDNLERLGIKCILHTGPKSYLSVDNVRMGSTAYYKGVASGDTIKGLARSGDMFTLSIDRAGQTYQVQLKALTPELAELNPLKGAAERNHTELPMPSLDVTQKKWPMVDVTQSPQPEVDVTDDKKKAEKKLVEYNIELIIDITGSMEFKDGTGDQTKFQWCHDQVRHFAELLAPYQKTFTITTFNTEYNTETNCNASRVEQIYASITPNGGTDLVDPLTARLNAALQNRQPGKATIIAVITDGCPNVPRDPRVVNRAIVDFTQKLTDPNEVILTVLQIGDTFDGKNFCLDLDDDLVNEGAKYDIVDTKTFDELKNEGLTRALVDAITEKRTTGHASVQHSSVVRNMRPPSSSAASAARVKDADAKLNDAQAERRALEKLLGVP